MATEAHRDRELLDHFPSGPSCSSVYGRALLILAQKHVRQPWLDSYFVYTSSLGTHTFFMMALPMFYFFGHFAIGNG
jgi:hypothetical protein